MSRWVSCWRASRQWLLPPNATVLLVSSNDTLAGAVEYSNFLRETSAEHVSLLLKIESRLEVEPEPLAGPEKYRASRSAVSAPPPACRARSR